MLPALAYWLIRLLTITLRIRVEDRSGILLGEGDGPGALIWVFWHNRMSTVAGIRRRVFFERHGVVLTSASKDGALLAAVMARFGVGSVRGSSFQRGVSALLGLVDVLKQGQDVVITPDGPRGPCYHLHPGVIKLAEITGAPVVPVHVRYTRFWQLKTWDAFRIPKPFSRVQVIIDVPLSIPKDLTAEALETQRQRLEKILRDEA